MSVKDLDRLIDQIQSLKSNKSNKNTEVTAVTLPSALNVCPLFYKGSANQDANCKLITFTFKGQVAS